MSLRLRLLLAVGAISILALVVADFATYSALRSSLYSQVDQELQRTRPSQRRSGHRQRRVPVATERNGGGGRVGDRGGPGVEVGAVRAVTSPMSSV